jgi:hypothetical protein
VAANPERITRHSENGPVGLDAAAPLISLVKRRPRKPYERKAAQLRRATSPLTPSLPRVRGVDLRVPLLAPQSPSVSVMITLSLRIFGD